MSKALKSISGLDNDRARLYNEYRCENKSQLPKVQGSPVPGIITELFLCLDGLPFCVNRVTGGAVPEGACSTDRETAFYFKAKGNKPMSNTNSNKTACIKQGSPEIIKPLSGGRENRDEMPGGYLNPTRTTSDDCKMPAPYPDAKELIADSPIRRAIAKRAEIRALGLDHPDTVTIAGITYDLQKLPGYQRSYYERLSRLDTGPTAAIKLKCYECSGYSSIEAANCQVKDCALWVLLHNRRNRNADTAPEVDHE